MFAARLKPRLIITGLVLHLALWLVVSLPVSFRLLPELYPVSLGVRVFASCVAFALALLLNVEIAREHRSAPWLRVAWLALAANAGISIFRMIFESPLLTLIWPEYTTELRGLWQHLAIVPANFSLLVGVVAMCLAYHRVGLGFEIERRDYVLMAAIAALLIALMVFRGGLSEAQSPYLSSRLLQQLGLLLLALVSAVSVVLHRMTMQMGGGKLALALRVLTLYALLRSLLVLLGALRPEFSPVVESIRSHLLTLAWQAVLWLPALAAAYRAQLTLNAARELQQLEARQAGRTAAALVS
ncbi:MAG: hypothetical protein U0Z53_19085 [Blastocatellia bacterium]